MPDLRVDWYSGNDLHLNKEYHKYDSPMKERMKLKEVFIEISLNGKWHQVFLSGAINYTIRQFWKIIPKIIDRLFPCFKSKMKL